MNCHQSWTLPAALAALLGVGPTIAWSQEGAKSLLTPERFDSLHALVKPATGEARWAEVEWMPAGDIWAARKKAAREGKPLFIWYMAGEPLGTC